ncbi:response regulator [Variovorax sp. VNK109]|uniref:response regulator n=1 Tax=Variovorax sp. VNK109 TaxID=3400919 RepID=UPI003C0A8E2E
MSNRNSQLEDSALPADAAGEDSFCGTSYAAKLLGMSVATVQSLVERGEIEAWKTRGGHRRISIKSINQYLRDNQPQSVFAESEPPTSLHVLVVEDDENTRELYKACFEEWSLPVDLSLMGSVLEALVDIATLRPDLLITDLDMPGVDGMEMLKVLRRNPALANMQVLAVTGMNEEAVNARGGLPAGTLFRQKPLNFDWLQGYVTALLTAIRAARGG